jgi:enolase-phosphatase E1
MVRVVITDVEGTTTPISFVKAVLFPYSDHALGGFLERNATDPATRAILDDVRAEAGLPAEARIEEYVATLREWIRADRKVTPLKTLQGMIWRDGYQRGEFEAPVYPDAVDALRRWHAAGIRLYVYSSGSVEAQRLLFAHTDHGDLTPLFSGYFDTRIGAKTESDSYRALAAAIGASAGDCLFLSDSALELEAAAAAGMATIQLLRPEDAPTPGRHNQAVSFAEIDPHAP